MDPQHPTPELIRFAYRRGIFPMVDPCDGRVEWFSPDPRAILPLDRFHVPRSLVRVIRRGAFEVRTDTAFASVIRSCASTRPGREQTWLDDRLMRAYIELHGQGDAHSVEAWLDDRLVGGLYGVRIGAAFFGESMFSVPDHGGTDASKVCLVHLVETLRARGFRLLDTQFQTPHLARFGCVEVPRSLYLELLAAATSVETAWPSADEPLSIGP
jgi:leucyl/phenylalanyl-tRNA--protein transferase